MSQDFVDNTTPTQQQPRLLGGISNFRPVNEEDLQIWNMYKEPLERQIREQFNVPDTYPLQPVQVATQLVAGQNYFFKVQLPDQTYATARVYHVPWKNDTHGKAQQVTINGNLTTDPNENIGYF